MTGLQVNAYDSVHVVDSLYRSKYMLTAMPSHLKDGEPLKLQQQNHKNKNKILMEEASTNLAEVHTSTDEVRHRVTILNNPEEVSRPLCEAQTNNEIETLTGPHEEKCEFRLDGSSSLYKPILPWINGDGTINKIVYKGLVRRVLGIVMQNPGILEANLLSQMNALNPQSCKRLLEVMILDTHIMVRKMYQSVSNEPPSLLNRLLRCSSKPKLICREHLFANLKSIDCL
ncbi:uncharacterized protein LOC143629355 [Bidens hawaiensis]|uniref:uncharacterized protein LOC143629355 n=1 Tax=Bidens hawaiensis TaxID=980011 RepID=UPI00404A070D